MPTRADSGVNIVTIPASVPFAETLARGVMKLVGDDPMELSKTAIYLPTRRAVRTMSDVFARVLGGAALLPELRPLGDVDEEEFLFDPTSEALDLPAAIDPLRRQLLLAVLVQRWQQARGRQIGFAQAANMAKGLAAFLDETETQGADLSKLETLAPESFAAHWAEVRDFLRIVRDEWPGVIAAEKKIDPAKRRNLALDALRKRLEAHPPEKPVIAAGSTGSIPATARLLGTIARMANGLVVLPGLDRELDIESWNDLDAGHPQYGMKQLLGEIGIERKDVRDWPESGEAFAAREHLLRETLRPAPTTNAWREIADRGGEDIAAGLTGLSLLEAGHPAEEAATIALMLRHALETPGKTAALVTPDRNLARRVAAEMKRWRIEIDDSAGQPLAHTRPGAFLCLIAEAVDAEFAPVQLLALLKHPLCANGMEPAQFRHVARLLDRLVLRGPRPDPGLAGIGKAIAAALAELREHEKRTRHEIEEAQAAFERLAATLQPLETLWPRKTASISALLNMHVSAAQALASTNIASGNSLLWRGAAGEAASRLIASLQAASETVVPDIEVSTYAPLFRMLAEDISVRPVRDQHPRLSILGVLEARLQRFDLVILGGLNEGTWPRAAVTDPWLSRPMRKRLGLEPPERAIGLSSHDFAMLAVGPAVVLSRAKKVEGAPTVPSRWLQRLMQLVDGLGLSAQLVRTDPYIATARQLDTPERIRPAERPQPMPPVDKRPRKLSVTEIETWLRDPYAIYAKHVLRLRPLDPLDAEVGALERGSAVHKALEEFLKEFPGHLPEWAEGRFVAIANDVFASLETPKSALALWQPRFRHAAHWFVAEERARRAGVKRSHAEIAGRLVVPSAGGEFTLTGKADRIDELVAGGAAILDYKTGAPPSGAQVKNLLAPQLPLEGAMLREDGFGIGKLAPVALIYIKFSGGRKPGEIAEVEADIAKLVADAEARLIARVNDFDRQEKPYHAQVAPIDTRRKSDYAHLERVREWAAGGWDLENE